MNLTGKHLKALSDPQNPRYSKMYRVIFFLVLEHLLNFSWVNDTEPGRTQIS